MGFRKGRGPVMRLGTGWSVALGSMGMCAGWKVSLRLRLCGFGGFMVSWADAGREGVAGLVNSWNECTFYIWWSDCSWLWQRGKVS